MAVKLSSYLCFRQGILFYLDNPRHMNSPGFSKEDLKTLRFIFDEIEELHDSRREESINKNPFIDQRVVLLGGIIEITEHTPKPELTKAFYEGIFNILRKYWLYTDHYKKLGECFEELDLQPSEDAKEAIEYANNIIKFKRHGSLEHMCWQTIKDHRDRKLKPLPPDW